MALHIVIFFITSHPQIIIVGKMIIKNLYDFSWSNFSNWFFSVVIAAFLFLPLLFCTILLFSFLFAAFFFLCGIFCSLFFRRQRSINIEPIIKRLDIVWCFESFLFLLNYPFSSVLQHLLHNISPLVLINFLIKRSFSISKLFHIIRLNQFPFSPGFVHSFYRAIQSFLCRFWPWLHTQEEHFFFAKAFNMFSGDDATNSPLDKNTSVVFFVLFGLSLNLSFFEFATKFFFHHNVFELLYNHIDSPNTLSAPIILLNHSNSLMNVH